MLLHLGSIKTLVISSADLAEDFLKTHDLSFANRPQVKASRIILYDGKDLAFAPYGEYWKQVRKICVIHLLSSKKVKSMAPIREEELALLMKRIASAASENGKVSITNLLNSFTVGLACRAVLGFSIERVGLTYEMIRKNSSFLAEISVEDYCPRLRWIDRMIGLEGKLKRHFKCWDDLLERVIREKLSSFGEEDESKDVAFIDVLLKGTDTLLTREHIKATLEVIIAASAETTFVVLDWTMIELVRHPEVMRKLQDEIRGVIIEEERAITEEHLSRMVYLKAVIKEILRLHPPAPLLLPRESVEDCRILQGRHEVPKGTRVLINVWAIGRDPENWEMPEEFRPERFLNGDIDYKGSHFQFIPFGAGRRICPGIHFAVATIDVALANLLCFFDWRLPDGVRAEDLNMNEDDGIGAPRKQQLELLPIPAQIPR
ncbi:Cytochrome P450 71A1 [Apostasia shenzhenica]|uniref:Cytochrome P450 71A1 n=1 Tax=Apostasia shenzhenica TaxID=1088818 RepID=A0A2I0A0E1_9ASPA|nr:Cytochrome P450 71A1 [Apostasia shenzhenica]